MRQALAHVRPMAMYLTQHDEEQSASIRRDRELLPCTRRGIMGRQRHHPSTRCYWHNSVLRSYPPSRGSSRIATSSPEAVGKSLQDALR